MSGILLTGGTGFIGSHTAVQLLNSGYEVFLLDNLSNSSADVIDKITQITNKKPIFFQADILDTQALNNIFEHNNIDTVIHFAGLKAVGQSCENPTLYFEQNISGTISLLDAMQKNNIKNLIFSSSATVYADENPMPLTESSKLGTSNPYGTTKYIIEQMLNDMAIFKNFNIVNLRYFNPIGAHPSGLIGENPKGLPNNLFPIILKVIGGDIPKLQVFGNRYPTVDGTGVRDYIEIMDLADAHIVAYDYILAHKSKEKGMHDVFNIGTGRGTSVLEMIDMFEQITGKNLPHKIVDPRAGDVATIYCDPSKANKILGWQAQNHINTAIHNGLNFYEKNR